MEDLARDYIAFVEREHRRPDGTPTRHKANVELALKLLRERHGSMPARDLTANHLKAIRHAFAGLGLTRTTINTRVGMIQTAAEWASHFGMVDDETLARLRTVRPLRRGMATEGAGVDAVPLERVLATIPGMPEYIALMTRFMLLTACRVGEAREARSSEVHRGETWCLRPAWHKNTKKGVKREIVLTQAARELVSPLMSRDYLFGPGEGKAPYHRDAVSVAVRRACERQRVKPWSPGQLRHTAAQIVMERDGMEATRAILGHTTDRLVRRYAGDVTAPQARDAARTLETRLTGKRGAITLRAADFGPATKAITLTPEDFHPHADRVWTL